MTTHFMKKISLVLSLCLGLLTLSAYAEQPGTKEGSDRCDALRMKHTTVELQNGQITSFWYVPKDSAKVYFSNLLGRSHSKKFVIQGDLLLIRKETVDHICATYIKKGRVSASGWIEKIYVRKFESVNFGSSQEDDEKSQKNLETAYDALTTLSNSLPTVRSWQGVWLDGRKNRVEIWQKGKVWKLNLTGIAGAISSGNDENDSLDLKVKDAMAISQEYSPEEDSERRYACDIVIVGFNNALLATSGTHCMGSGDHHAWPQFSGIYWKK